MERSANTLTAGYPSTIIGSMHDSYEAYVERLQQYTTREGLSDLRLAREEFHRLTGEFEEGEPWFETRMRMFLDWYLLDRRGPNDITPVEGFLETNRSMLDEADRKQFEHLTVTLRSVFKIVRMRGDSLLLDDLAGGGQWLARWILPTVGIKKNDILNSRMALFDGTVTIGRGAVLHPREALESVEGIVARAFREEMPARQIVDHLDKMRLKLDRYSNVKIRHVYQYPDDALL